MKKHFSCLFLIFLFVCLCSCATGRVGLANKAKLHGREEFIINIDNYKDYFDLGRFAGFGPEYNQDYTEEEFVRMMTLILGADKATEILNQIYSYSVDLPSLVRVKSTNGVVSDGSVTFSVKLLDILLLKDPLVFYIEY